MLKPKLLVGMFFLLLPLVASAMSLRMLDPLAGMEHGSVDVRFGDPLRIDDPKAEGLFGGDIGRADRFAAVSLITKSDVEKRCP